MEKDWFFDYISDSQVVDIHSPFKMDMRNLTPDQYRIVLCNICHLLNKDVEDQKGRIRNRPSFLWVNDCMPGRISQVSACSPYEVYFFIHQTDENNQEYPDVSPFIFIY